MTREILVTDLRILYVNYTEQLKRLPSVEMGYNSNYHHMTV